MRRPLLAVTLAVLAAAPRARGEDEDGLPWEARSFQGPEVRALLDALDRGDETATAAIVGAPGSDPVRLAYGAWLARVDGAAGTSGDAAAAEVARRAPFGPGSEAFRDLVASWAGLDAAGRAAERRRAELSTRMARLRVRGAWPEVLAALDAERDDLARATRSPAAVSLGMVHAIALTRLGSDADALVVAHGECFAAATALPWPEAALTVCETLYGVERRRGRFAAGLAALDRSLPDADRRLSPLSRARLRERRAEALGRLNRTAESLAELDAAGRLYASGRDGVGERRTALTAAFRWKDLGRMEEARAAANRLRRSALDAADAPLAARALALLGQVAMREGRLAAALPLLEQAVVEAERLEPQFHRHLTNALANLGLTETNLGFRDAAIGHLARAIDVRRKNADLAGALQATPGLAQLLAWTGREGEAEALLASSVEEARVGGLTRERGRLLVTRGLLRLRAADYVAALAFENEAAAALLEAEATVPLPIDRGRAEAYAVHALLGLGRFPEATVRARAARALVPADFPYVDAACTALARALVLSGDAAGALPEVRMAVEAQRRRALGMGDADPEKTIRDVRDTTELGVRAALGLPAADGARAAFPFVEAGRASVLAGALLQRDALLGARLGAELLTDERASREELSEAMEQFSRAATRTTGTSDRTESARAALDAAYRRRIAVLARVGREARGAVELLAPAEPGVDEVRAGLREGEAYVAWHGASDALRHTLAAVVVTRDGDALVDLGDAAEILDKASAWLDVVSAPGSREEVLAARLYDRLVRPLEPALGGARRWVLSPDDVLSFLPWGALRRTEGETSERLVERAELVLVPSASVREILRSRHAARRGRGAIVVADPTPAAGAKELPAARAEAEAVLALHVPERSVLLTGDEASAAELRVRLERAGERLAAVHLAVHGVFDPAHPRLSGLLLAHGERLLFDDVAAFRFEADLAVLSGCDTTKGALRAGEGVLGSVRAFFLAGCPRVVASSWRVSDASTRTLMVRFTEAMARDGLSPAAALRAAQRERLAAGGEGAHPYHWAAFQLWGLAE